MAASHRSGVHRSHAGNRATTGTAGTGVDPTSNRAAIDKDGKVVAWHSRAKSFSKRDLLTNEGDPANTPCRSAHGRALRHTAIFGPLAENYAFESKRKASSTMRRCSIEPRRCGRPTCAIPVDAVNVAVESFMDELALATNMDPVEFRLRYLKTRATLRSSKRPAEKAGWKAHVDARRQVVGLMCLSAQGMAYSTRSAPRVAMVADVEVNRNNRQSLGPPVCWWLTTAGRSSRPTCCD